MKPDEPVEALEMGIEGESPKRVSPLIYSLSTVPATGNYLNSDHTEVSFLGCTSSFGLAAGLPDQSSWNVTEGEKNEAIKTNKNKTEPSRSFFFRFSLAVRIALKSSYATSVISFSIGPWGP